MTYLLESEYQMVESIQSNKVLLMITKLQSVAHNHIFCRISFTNSVTIAKRRSKFIKKSSKLVARQPN